MLDPDVCAQARAEEDERQNCSASIFDLKEVCVDKRGDIESESDSIDEDEIYDGDIFVKPSESRRKMTAIPSPSKCVKITVVSLYND